MQERFPKFQFPLEGFDENFYPARLPFSNFKREIPEDSIYKNAFKNFPLARLCGIRKLSNLSHIGPNSEKTVFLQFDHETLDHSVTVAVLSEEILRKNGFPEEKIIIGIIARLLHDIATPAFGDAAKKLDPQALNEEKFWWETLGEQGQDFTSKKLGISRETPDKIIKNEGILGQVLDISDRITYVMNDLAAVIEPIKSYEPELGPYVLSLRHLAALDPKIGDIYKEVGVDERKDKVFFNDPQRLNRFLLIRANLYKYLYVNPISQGRDLLVAKLLSPLYSRDEKSPLNPNKLRSITDSELIIQEMAKKLPKLFGDVMSYPEIYYTLFNTLINWYPKYEKFDDFSEANKKALELSKKKSIVVLGVNECPGFDSGTTYDVTTPKGEIIPFKNFMPNEALEIEQIEKSTRGFFVLYENISEDSRINDLLRKVLKINK